MVDKIKTHVEFDADNNVITPESLRKYMSKNNVNLDEYDEKFFRFYSWDNIKSVEDCLANQRGVPDCSNIINTMRIHNNCYVFADYMFSMFFYAIFLKEDKERYNHVYVIAGDKFKLIANSFEDFITLYEQESLALQFG